jgi:hypothetical protein
MQTAPQQVLAALRESANTEQMATFAEALYTSHRDRDWAPYHALPLVAAAYLLGRVDALKEGVPEVNGSGGPMAESVLRAANLLACLDDVPF